MIQYEQGHAFHFGRVGEPQQRLAVAVRTQAHVNPPLVCHLALGVGHAQQSLVPLGFSLGPPLRLFDDGAGIVSSAEGHNEGKEDKGGKGPAGTSPPKADTTYGSFIFKGLHERCADG